MKLRTQENHNDNYYLLIASFSCQMSTMATSAQSFEIIVISVI